MPRMLNPDSLLERYRAVPWFSRLGQPLPAPTARIGEWDDWTGPDDPKTEAIHLRQQELHDSVRDMASDPTEFEREFQELVRRLVGAIKACVPYDEEADAWHAPSSAVWHAAWTAALVAAYRAAAIDLPPELGAQWSWFVDGHWPASLAAAGDPFDRTGYIVY